ncbi:MAG: hypothetical protein U0354_15770 [Candidatus Sericytochromatia bacterium]
MSTTGISGNSPIQPRLSEGQQGEGLGGAKQRDDVEKSNESHKALHKSRTEEHQQKIKFMVTKAGNAAKTMHNALLKNLRSDRVAEKMFTKVHSTAIRQITRRMVNRASRRGNSESLNANEDLKQKQLQAQLAIGSKLRPSDIDTDMDMDADTDEGGDLSGGQKDQESMIMFIKSMYGEKEQPLIKETLAKIEDNNFSDEEKLKVVKTLHNNDINKNPSLSDNLLKTINSDEFKSLSNETKNIILDFMSGDNIKKSSITVLKNQLEVSKKQFTGVLEGVTYINAKNKLTENNLFKYKDNDISLMLYVSNQKSSLSLLGSRIDLKNIKYKQALRKY